MPRFQRTIEPERFVARIRISTQALLEAAFDRMKTKIRQRNIVPYKFHPSNSDFEPHKNSTNFPAVEIVTISEVKKLELSTSATGLRSKAYAMSIESNGKTSIQITPLKEAYTRLKHCLNSSMLIQKYRRDSTVRMLHCQ